jgi:hypothetical protein
MQIRKQKSVFHEQENLFRVNRTVDDDDDPKNFKSIRSIGIGVSVTRLKEADFTN